MPNRGMLWVCLTAACSTSGQTGQTATTDGFGGTPAAGVGGATTTGGRGGALAISSGAVATAGGSSTGGGLGGTPGASAGSSARGGTAASSAAGTSAHGGAAGNPASDAGSAQDAGGGSGAQCACNADVNGDGVPAYFATDGYLLSGCIREGTSAPCPDCRGGTCAVADIDCNGRVDQCDVYRLACAEVGGEGCCDVPCGACEIPATAEPSVCSGAGLDTPCCRSFEEDYCIQVGEFLGADVPCPG